MEIDCGEETKTDTLSSVRNQKKLYARNHMFHGEIYELLMTLK